MRANAEPELLFVRNKARCCFVLFTVDHLFMLRLACLLDGRAVPSAAFE